MMTDNNNSYQVQSQDKSPVNSPVAHHLSPHHAVVVKQEQLTNDYIEESPPPSSSYIRKQSYLNPPKSPPIDQQKQEMANCPNEHQRHNYANSLYPERQTRAEVSSPDLQGVDRTGTVVGGNDGSWNDAEEDTDRSSPGIPSNRMDSGGPRGFLSSGASNTLDHSRSRISSPPLPPPPPAHYSSRLLVRQIGRNQISPTNWHQPQNQLDYIHQQQHHQLQPSDESLQNHIQQAPNGAFGMLKHENDVLYITENCIEIGRNSSTSHVHFHVARNSFVSRKHFQVLYDPATCEFYVACLSKNGVFVDDVFQRRYAEPMKLPKSCSFRFPSTEIRILFESFADSTTALSSTTQAVVSGNATASSSTSRMHYFSDRKNLNAASMEGSSVIYSPLKITIPKTEQKSPYPSPTGTISAANSCPTSPRQGFQDYQSYSSYNNNNNNLQSQELFQTPATSNYNDHEKPPYSYAQLIVQSISAAPDKQLTLSGIYSFISKHYPYYRKEANKGWQNSIRHNLSLNRYFIKVARSQDEPGKGSFWRIDPTSEAKLIDQSYKKRRQRGSQCFRPSYGMPRSAPVSPSHIDNSRESSPLHDIVLQSAPGSPGISYQGHLENHSAEDLMYSSQNVMQPSSFNAHNQYNNSPYHISSTHNSSSGQQQSIIVSNSGQLANNGTSSINGGGALIAAKRHHAATITSAQSMTATGNTQHHPDNYEEVHDYNTAAGCSNDSGDECDTMKRPKYTTEINQ